MRALWRILGGHRSLRLLLSAGLISLTGDWILRTGLAYYVYALTGSTLASATTTRRSSSLTPIADSPSAVARAASEAARLLAKALTPDGLPISVEKNGDQFQLELPAPLGQLMLDVLTHVGRGEMITLVPYGAELTTKEAADLLNVSRPFLVKLLDEGVIDHHKVGSHRRIRANELLAYKAKRDEERRAAMTELQRLGQEFDAD